MSKRAPGFVLTHLNWEQDVQREDQGTWNRANESTLKERVIMRAQRNKTCETKDSCSTKETSALCSIGDALKVPVVSTTFSFETKKDESQKEGKTDAIKNTEIKTSDDEIRNLNKAVIKFVGNHLEINPICDLRPVFVDYKKYMDKFDDLYGTEWKQPANKGNQIEMKMKSTEDNVNKVTEEKKQVISFNKQKESEKSDKPKPIFSFSGSTDTEANNKPPVSSGTFFANLERPKPLTSDFRMGGAGSFSFNVASSTPIHSVPVSSNTAADDDEYTPPVVENKEFDDAKDALFNKKAKIFYAKDGKYKEIGVGKLFVKPLEDNKASILVRADNTLGNILLNVAIPSAPEPTKTGKNNCILSVVPNPPIDGVEGAVPLLIRVKTSEDADELISIIKSKQNAN